MARALAKIDRDLQALEASWQQLRDSLDAAYRQYLAALARSLERQLAQAAFQVCTQAYPDAFLALSLAQRHQLQQALKQLGDRARAELTEHLDALQSGTLDCSAQASEAVTEGTPPATGDGVAADSESAVPTQADSVQGADSAQGEASTTEGRAPAAESEPDSAAGTEPPASEDSPDGADTAPDWVEAIDDRIGERLQAVSLETNQLLQGAGIVPEQLPSNVLKAALQSDEAEASAGGEANLLTVLLGSSNDRNARNSQAMRVTMVRLRRAELEFGDPGLNSERNRIHQLRQQYDRLQQQYRQTQQERAIAAAEAAWNASWFQA